MWILDPAWPWARRARKGGGFYIPYVCHVHIPETHSMHGYSWIPHCNWKSIVSVQISSVLYSSICTDMLLSVFDLFQIPNKIGRWLCDQSTYIIILAMAAKPQIPILTLFETFFCRARKALSRHRQLFWMQAARVVLQRRRPLQSLHRDTRGHGKKCEKNVFAPLNSKSALPNARTIIGFSSSLPMTPRWLWNFVLYISLWDNPNQFNQFLVDKMLRTECPTGFHG